MRLRVHLGQVRRVAAPASVVCLRLCVDVRVRHAVRSRTTHVRTLHLRSRQRSER